MEKESICKEDDFIFTRENEWRTYDGRQIKIKDMEDSHVLNLLNYVGRRVKGYQEQLDSYQKDEDSNFSEFEAMMCKQKQEYLDKNLTILNVINEEIKLRNLDRSKVDGGNSLPFKKDGVWMEWKKDALRPTPILSSIDFMNPIEDRVKNLKRESNG